MEYKFEYETQTERRQILDDNQNLFWIEEKNIIDGNFLVFSDIPIIKNIPDSKPSYEELENQVLLLTDQLAGGIL